MKWHILVSCASQFVSLWLKCTKAALDKSLSEMTCSVIDVIFSLRLIFCWKEKITELKSMCSISSEHNHGFCISDTVIDQNADWWKLTRDLGCKRKLSPLSFLLPRGRQRCSIGRCWKKRVFIHSIIMLWVGLLSGFWSVPVRRAGSSDDLKGV